MEKEIKEGHEPEKDAFEMSAEEFSDELDKVVDTDEPTDDKIETDTDKPGGDADKIDTKTPDESTKPAAEDTKLPADDTPKEGDDKQVEITHNGVVHKITTAKALELAQKGFDYDTKVGPHGRLVQLITSRPEIAKLVHDHVVGNVTGPQASGKGNQPEPEKIKFKPLSEYDGDTGTEEWLTDNIKIALASQPKPVAPVAPTAPRTNVDPMVDRNPDRLAKLLFDHDPTGFGQVAPRLAEAYENLTVKRSKEIGSSYAELQTFYDEVKAQETPSTSPPANPPATPSFRVKPGGGASARDADQSAHAWELPKKDFDAILEKAKGY